MPENKRNLLILGILIFTLGITFLAVSKKDTLDQTSDNANKLANSNAKSVEDLMNNKEEAGMMENLMSNPNSLVANLEDANGGELSGTAYILREESALKHSVVAVLPDPAEGNLYEGWLVQQEPLAFFSTGVMEKDDEGNYYLVFESDELAENYNFVVITEETEIDDTPEIHVIEGLAQPQTN